MRLHKSRVIILGSMVVLLLVVAGSIIAYSLIHASNIKKAKIVAERIQLNGYINPYLSVYGSITQSPTDTTRDKAGWDTYFDGLSAQVSSNISTLQTKQYDTSDLNEYQNVLLSSFKNIANLITLSKSAQDMSFQLSTDQALVNLDTQSLSSQEGYASVDGNYTYVTEAKTALSGAQSTLSADQQTSQKQINDLPQLMKIVLADPKKINSIAGPAIVQTYQTQ